MRGLSQLFVARVYDMKSPLIESPAKG